FLLDLTLHFREGLLPSRPPGEELEEVKAIVAANDPRNLIHPQLEDDLVELPRHLTAGEVPQVSAALGVGREAVGLGHLAKVFAGTDLLLDGPRLLGRADDDLSSADLLGLMEIRQVSLVVSADLLFGDPHAGEHLLAKELLDDQSSGGALLLIG